MGKMSSSRRRKKMKEEGEKELQKNGEEWKEVRKMMRRSGSR